MTYNHSFDTLPAPPAPPSRASSESAATVDGTPDEIIAKLQEDIGVLREANAGLRAMLSQQQKAKIIDTGNLYNQAEEYRTLAKALVLSAGGMTEVPHQAFQAAPGYELLCAATPFVQIIRAVPKHQ